MGVEVFNKLGCHDTLKKFGPNRSAVADPAVRWASSPAARPDRIVEHRSTRSEFATSPHRHASSPAGNVPNRLTSGTGGLPPHCEKNVMPVTPLVTVTRSRVIGTPRAIRAPGGSIGYTRGRSPWMVDLDAIMFGAVRSAFPLESAAVTPADVDRVGGTGGRDTTPPSDPDTNGPGHDFAHLVAEHSAAVYRLARSVVRDPGLADDVTQDTFI